MKQDIVARLRNGLYHVSDVDEAADEIEVLRLALRLIADMTPEAAALSAAGTARVALSGATLVDEAPHG